MTDRLRESKGSRLGGRRGSPLVTTALTLAFFGLVPGVTWAQSGIAGIVKDTSGAVLPGVTVEAASPALIEKVRTVVTDEQGRYNIVDLRPGTYISPSPCPASTRSSGRALICRQRLRRR